MFSGIIIDLGEIVGLRQKSGLTLQIASNIDQNNYKLGSSIATDGICLTVTKKIKANIFEVELSPETINVTTAKYFKLGDKLNLELSLKMGEEISGHLVTGHVDDLVRIKDKRQEGEFWIFEFYMPEKLKYMIAKKCSITVNGISLTVNEVLDNYFTVCIIPYTYNHTNLQFKQIDDYVNIEIDIIARYINRRFENGN